MLHHRAGTIRAHLIRVRESNVFFFVKIKLFCDNTFYILVNYYYLSLHLYIFMSLIYLFRVFVVL